MSLYCKALFCRMQDWQFKTAELPRKVGVNCQSLPMLSRWSARQLRGYWQYCHLFCIAKNYLSGARLTWGAWQFCQYCQWFWADRPHRPPRLFPRPKSLAILAMAKQLPRLPMFTNSRSLPRLPIVLKSRAWPKLPMVTNYVALPRLPIATNFGAWPKLPIGFRVFGLKPPGRADGLAGQGRRVHKKFFLFFKSPLAQEIFLFLVVH